VKTSHVIKGFLVLLILAVTAGILVAQQPVRPAAPVDAALQLRIKKFIGLGKQSLVKTPVYTTTAVRSVTREQDWFRVWVQYETAPEWIDEVVFQYHVLAKMKVDGRDVFSLYRKSVKYIDVEKGREHMSAVFLRPSAIKRYGDVVASAVEISINGQPAAVKFEVGMQLPDKWWSNAAVTESAAVTVRDGYLLDRRDTPFAFVNVDDYEVIK